MKLGTIGSVVLLLLCAVNASPQETALYVRPVFSPEPRPLDCARELRFEVYASHRDGLGTVLFAIQAICDGPAVGPDVEFVQDWTIWFGGGFALPFDCGATVLVLGKHGLPASAETHLGVVVVRFSEPYLGSLRLVFPSSFPTSPGGGDERSPVATINGGAVPIDELRPSDTFLVGCPQFVRGETNLDGRVDIADGINILLSLFRGSSSIACLDRADVNDDGTVNMTDPVALFEFLFRGGAPVPAPYPEAGLDPSEDELECPLNPE